MTAPHAPIPYPPIERLGVIGDRRTAAIVAADGTIPWLCLPNYDGDAAFGALLDAGRGGAWRLGPAAPTFGRQRYHDDSTALLTTWTTDEADLELTDAMLWPWDRRDDDDGDGVEAARVLVRRLRCSRGTAACAFDLGLRHDFGEAPNLAPAGKAQGEIRIALGDHDLRLWTSRPVDIAEGDGAVRAAFDLAAGEEFWAVLALDDPDEPWSAKRAAAELDRTVRFWGEWAATLRCPGRRATWVRRSAVTVYLLSYAPTGSPVAAPTTSLPERIGGDRNWDYRYAWVRDASLALALLIRLGDTDAARRYMDCLATYRSETDAPLQVVYAVDGATKLPERERGDLAGYRGSLPVRLGNGAAHQHQLDSLGFFADCALTYLQEGGAWREAYWEIVRRAADHVVKHWREPDAGIWEMRANRHFVSSKVMGWVTLDRAVRIADLTAHATQTDGWRATMAAIHAEVMARGWSDERGAFRQHYDSDALDAAALLVSLFGFLPPDHPRVLSTLDQIEATLSIAGLVHRYVPDEAPTPHDLPLGEFEGAFLPCTFWLAAARARAGQTDRAEAILGRADALAGDLGLFAEEVDARSGAFLGNTPLLFSQVEYARAALDLERALGGS